MFIQSFVFLPLAVFYLLSEGKEQEIEGKGKEEKRNEQKAELNKNLKEKEEGNKPGSPGLG